MYGGELQGFSGFSAGLEEMRYTCQYWKAGYSVGGPVLSACLKEPTKHMGSLLGLFPWLGRSSIPVCLWQQWLVYCYC